MKYQKLKKNCKIFFKEIPETFKIKIIKLINKSSVGLSRRVCVVFEFNGNGEYINDKAKFSNDNEDDEDND